MGHVMAPTVSESGGPNELDTENGRAGPSLSLLIGVVELDWPELVEPQTDGPLVGTIINYK